MILSNAEIDALHRGIPTHLLIETWPAAVAAVQLANLPVDGAPGPRFMRQLAILNEVGRLANGSLPLRRVLEVFRQMTVEQSVCDVVDRTLARVDAWLAEHPPGETQVGGEQAPQEPAVEMHPWTDVKLTAKEHRVIAIALVAGLAATISILVVSQLDRPGWWRWIVYAAGGTVDVLLALFAFLLLAGILFAGAQARRAVADSPVFWAIAGVIAVAAAVVAVVFQRPPTLADVVETAGGGALAGLWATCVLVALSGHPGAWFRYLRHHIAPFPCWVRVDRSAATFVLTIDEFPVRDGAHERVTCRLTLSPTIDDSPHLSRLDESEAAAAEASVAIKCAIHEDLLTELAITKRARLAPSFEDRCAELYYACILLEHEAIFAKRSLPEASRAHEIVITDTRHGDIARKILKRLG